VFYEGALDEPIVQDAPWDYPQKSGNGSSRNSIAGDFKPRRQNEYQRKCPATVGGQPFPASALKLISGSMGQAGGP
jgi:hypothetical protein